MTVRQSPHIEYREAQKFQLALLKSKSIGLPFDTLITLNLENLGYPYEQCPAAWLNMRKRLAPLHEKHGIKFCAAWVLENPPTASTHVHCLIHRGQFKGNRYRHAFLKRIKHSGVPPKLVKIDPFHPNKPWEENIHTLIPYLLKGLHPIHKGLIEGKVQDQGIIHGKRIGWTRNITP